jgi:broad specificity phosphatase PhoE
MTTLRLVLVRHGQTESNVAFVLDSRPPGPPLTEEGRRQAERIAERLAGEPVVAVYASTAVRAQQTAQPIAAAHGLEVVVADGVHEVDVGDFEGRSDQAAIEQFIGVYRAWHAGDLVLPVPGGESGQQLLDRFLPVVERIRQEHPDGVVVLVSHGAAIRLAARTLAANVDSMFADAHFVPNGGAVVLEADGAAWRCLSWDGVGPQP